MTVQYRLLLPGKVPDVVDGPDDATVVITVPVADATSDPAVAYMQGKLKAAGRTGELFELFRSGEAAAALGRLAAP
ncbi:MAG: hypothetical protein JWL70_1683 [Acidimicrobiia bacterium]|nr:hypothetical protein [Acidimicrobiia bacterium]